MNNIGTGVTSSQPLEIIIPVTGSAWTVATSNIKFYIAELDQNDNIIAMKIQEPPSLPGYGAYSTITAIPNVDVESYFSIKSSNNVDLVMNTIVTEA